MSPCGWGTGELRPRQNIPESVLPTNDACPGMQSKGPDWILCPPVFLSYFLMTLISEEFISLFFFFAISSPLIKVIASSLNVFLKLWITKWKTWHPKCSHPMSLCAAECGPHGSQVCRALGPEDSICLWTRAKPYDILFQERSNFCFTPLCN